MLALLFKTARDPQKGMIIPFRGAGIENNLLGPGADGARDGFPSVFQNFKGFPPKGVRARRISEPGIKIRLHRLDDARVCRSRGGIIEVYPFHDVPILSRGHFIVNLYSGYSLR